jgi:hypothetical protein
MRGVIERIFFFFSGACSKRRLSIALVGLPVPPPKKNGEKKKKREIILKQKKKGAAALASLLALLVHRYKDAKCSKRRLSIYIYRPRRHACTKKNTTRPSASNTPKKEKKKKRAPLPPPKKGHTRVPFLRGRPFFWPPVYEREGRVFLLCLFF